MAIVFEKNISVADKEFIEVTHLLLSMYTGVMHEVKFGAPVDGQIHCTVTAPDDQVGTPEYIVGMVDTMRTISEMEELANLLALAESMELPVTFAGHPTLQ